MAAIFHMGTLTLSATSAQNGHGGCGLTKELRKTTRFGNSSGKGPDFAVRETAEITPGPGIILNTQLRNAPVNKRAWILQEQMLSRRKLHAMDSQFVWECAMFTESEDGILYKQGKNASLNEGDGRGEYDALALFAYVQSATLKNQPPYITMTYLIVKATDSGNKDEYMRIGRMQLTEPFNMNLRHEYLPEGIQRDIILV
ncbi:HET domain-containing protein pin-c1 [Pyrenophora tritici-repentis]|nr:HET domain-containing protein pin-c1 [Pyrenophora tritici-repentis]